MCEYVSIARCISNGVHLSNKTDAGLGGPLDIECDDSQSCYGFNVSCPAHNSCDIQCNGENACIEAYIKGTNGSKLNIDANGRYVMWETNIICPPDTIPGDEYLDGGSCNISVSGHQSMIELVIKSMDGWNGVQLICQSPPCSTAGSPELFCGTDLTNYCLFEPIITGRSSDPQSEWRCVDEDNICNYRSTSLPTQSPTLYPTHDADNGPANTLFVSQMNGCDAGLCQTNEFDIRTVCQSKKFENYACCSDHPPTKLEPDVSVCNASNTVSIDSTEIFENYVHGDVYDYYGNSSDEDNATACFGVDEGFDCWLPKVVQFEFIQIGYGEPLHYMNVAYKTAENQINFEGCTGTDRSCAVSSSGLSCPDDIELGDDVWSYNSGPYAFYFDNSPVKMLILKA